MPPGIHCPAPPSSRWSNCGKYDQPHIVEIESVIGARTNITQNRHNAIFAPKPVGGRLPRGISIERLREPAISRTRSQSGIDGFPGPRCQERNSCPLCVIEQQDCSRCWTGLLLRTERCCRCRRRRSGALGTGPRGWLTLTGRGGATMVSPTPEVLMARSRP
jgi:hypothetical protein